MVELLIGGKGSGSKSKIKSKVVELLSKSEKVCVVCSEKDADYYANVRWRSKKYHIKNIENLTVYSPLTIVSFEELNSHEVVDSSLIYCLFAKDFTSIFLDESHYVLKSFIDSNDGLNRFIDELNSKYADIRVTISCQQFEQLVSS